MSRPTLDRSGPWQLVHCPASGLPVACGQLCASPQAGMPGPEITVMPRGRALVPVALPEQETRAVAVPVCLPADSGRRDQVPRPCARAREKPAAGLVSCDG